MQLTRSARVAAVALALVAIAGCGSGGSGEPAQRTTTTPSTPSPASHRPDGIADRYALAMSRGERLGCGTLSPVGDGDTEAQSGAEHAMSADVPGCIYVAAYAGCWKGASGMPLSGMPPATEDFPEPRLNSIYRQAVSDCRP